MSESIEQLDGKFTLSDMASAFTKLKKTLLEFFDKRPQPALKNPRGVSLAGFYRDSVEGADSLKATLELFCWKVEISYGSNIKDGSDYVHDIQYTGGNNYGSISYPLEQIAEFVEAGSYIEMSGEEGRRWRWVFDGKTCKQVFPVLTWPT